MANWRQTLRFSRRCARRMVSWKTNPGSSVLPPMPIFLFLMGIDAISIGAGGNGGGAHSLQEWYDPAGREMGLKRALLTLLGIAEVAPEKTK